MSREEREEIESDRERRNEIESMEREISVEEEKEKIQLNNIIPFCNCCLYRLIFETIP